MKIKTLIIALTLSIGLFTACTDKKKTEKNHETEVKSEENSTSFGDNIDEAERKRLDSIYQVKEHGHAH